MLNDINIHSIESGVIETVMIYSFPIVLWLTYFNSNNQVQIRNNIFQLNNIKVDRYEKSHPINFQVNRSKIWMMEILIWYWSIFSPQVQTQSNAFVCLSYSICCENRILANSFNFMIHYSTYKHSWTRSLFGNIPNDTRACPPKWILRMFVIIRNTCAWTAEGFTSNYHQFSGIYCIMLRVSIDILNICMCI